LIATFAALADATPLVCMAQTDADYRVLSADFNADEENQMMRAYQRKQVHAALDARLMELDAAFATPEAIAAYQQKRSEFLESSFGPVPKRTPLNAEVTKTIDRDGYTIENVLLESLPGFHVTGNVYRPKGAGPFPGILLPCGHSANGKAYSSYQKASILFAQHDFVVLCFDPVGQGERRQLIGDRPHTIRQPRGEHNAIGVAPILLGRTLASMMVWDGMRGIDYLCSRADVDPQRIGCTGISGGGNLTSYLMAFDQRIVAAAPGCFMTTHRRKNETPGPGDAEQNLFAQIRNGFDHPDFILTRAETDVDSSRHSRLCADRRNVGSVSSSQTPLHSPGLCGTSRSNRGARKARVHTASSRRIGSIHGELAAEPRTGTVRGRGSSDPGRRPIAGHAPWPSSLASGSAVNF